MFFQTINQMITAGTDLSINIRRVSNNLAVAVVPKRSGLKEGDAVIPLILNGTPEELDAGFLQAIGTPIQKAQGILTNLASFEKQAEQAVSQSKAAKAVTEKEPKEVREKREKMEKLLKKAEDATTGKRYSEALAWLKQAKALAGTDKQQEIDAKMAEVQKKASEGSLFGMEQPAMPDPQRPQQPAGQQPATSPEPQYPDGGQIPMFPPGQPNPAPQPAFRSQTPQPAADNRRCFTHNMHSLCHSRSRFSNRQLRNRRESASTNRYRCHSHGWTADSNGYNRLRHSHNMCRFRKLQEPMAASDTARSPKKAKCTTSTRNSRKTGSFSKKTRMSNTRIFRKNAL